MNDEVDPPDAGMQLVKAQIAAALRRISIDRTLSEAEAEALLGLSQPEVVRLFQGDGREQSLYRLMTCLNAFGYDVEIVSRPCRSTDGRGGRITLTSVAA